MKSEKARSILAVLGLSLAACVTREGAASHQGGAAGEAPSGTGAGQGGQSGTIEECGDDATGLAVVTAACISPALQFQAGAARITDLAVVNRLPGNISPCFDGTYLPSLGGQEYRGIVTGPGVGWQLRAESGETWEVQFAIGSVPDDLLAPGDIVDLTSGSYLQNGIDLPARGYVALEREGSPVIFLAEGVGPSFPDVSYNVTAGPTLCGRGEGCGIATSVVTVNGDTAELAIDERAELGGLVIQNDRFSDQSRCTEFGLRNSVSTYLLGAYAMP